MFESAPAGACHPFPPDARRRNLRTKERASLLRLGLVTSFLVGKTGLNRTWVPVVAAAPCYCTADPPVAVVYGVGAVRGRVGIIESDCYWCCRGSCLRVRGNNFLTLGERHVQSSVAGESGGRGRKEMDRVTA